MSSILLAILILLPLLIYLFAAFQTPKEKQDPDTFFLAPGQISSTEFANTSVAYGFQIASVSVFIAWGFHYGLGAFVNPFFWGVGIFLFALALRRVTPFFGSRQTLHGFLGHCYNSRALTVIASLMTLVGFIGAFTAELVWGSYVLSLINPNPIFIYSVTTVMALFVVYYLCRCGAVSVIKTDQYQVLFAHAGFLSAGVAVVTLLHWKGQRGAAVGFLLSGALTLILVVMLLAIRRQRKLELASEAHALQNVQTAFLRRVLQPTGLLQILFITALIGAVVNLFFFFPAIRSLPSVAQERNLHDFSQGTLNLLSLALLPLCWQFVDVTNWQRIGAVQLSQKNDGDLDVRPIRLGLLRTAFESPASWIFAILLGVGLHYSEIGMDGDSVWMALGEFPQLLAGGTTPFGQLLGTALAIMFAAGVVAAMLSTADSLLMGSTFTFVYDLIPAVLGTTSDSFLKDSPKRAIQFGKLSALLFAIGGLVSYWVAAIFNVDLLSLLFGAFSAQVSLFPAVVGTLFLRERAPSAPWAIASVGIGFVGGMVTVIIALQDASWQLYPPLVTLALSVSIFVFGAFLRMVRKGIAAVVIVASLGVPFLWMWSWGADKFWLGWEVSSAGITTVYTFIILVECVGVKPKFWELLKSEAAFLISGLISIGAVILLAAALFAFWEAAFEWQWLKFFDSRWHVGSLLGGLLLMLAGNFLLVNTDFDESDPNEPKAKTICFASRTLVKNEGGSSENIAAARAAVEQYEFTFRNSDVPTVIVFAFFTVFVWVLVVHHPSVDETLLKAFIGGAVSFQLILSNVFYGVSVFAPQTKKANAANRTALVSESANEQRQTTLDSSDGSARIE